MSCTLFPRYKQLIAELRDEARRMAANIAKLESCLSQPVRWRSPMGAPQSGHRLSFFAQASVPSSTSAAKPYRASCAIIRWLPCEAVEHLRDAGR
jgi:hypothetical protein